MKNKSVEKIFNEILKSKYGLTIQNLIDRTGFARGTIKSYLNHMMITDNVLEVNYGQNTKVYYAKKVKYTDKSTFNSIHV